MTQKKHWMTLAIIVCSIALIGAPSLATTCNNKTATITGTTSIEPGGVPLALGPLIEPNGFAMGPAIEPGVQLEIGPMVEPGGAPLAMGPAIEPHGFAMGPATEPGGIQLAIGPMVEPGGVQLAAGSAIELHGSAVEPGGEPTTATQEEVRKCS